MYKLFILPSAQKDCDKLSEKIFGHIKNKLLLLERNPRPSGCVKMTGKEGYRVRSGDYRILYRINDKEKIVYIYRVKHRRESYR